MRYQKILLFVYLMESYVVSATPGHMIRTVVEALGVRQVLLLIPSDHMLTPALHHTAQEMMIRSLWTRDILTSVSSLQTYRTCNSAHDTNNSRSFSSWLTPRDGHMVENSTRDRPVTADGGVEGVLLQRNKVTDENMTVKIPEKIAEVLEAMGRAAVLLMGDVAWVTHVAVLMNQKMLLSPNNILLLHPTSGSIPEKSLVPHLRLAAKLLVLEWHLPAPSLGKSSKTDRGSCLAPVKQARLLPGGTYKLKTAGCWYSNNRGLVLHDSLLPAVDTLHSAVITVVIVKNFIEAVRVGPQGQFLVGYLGKVVNALATSLGFRFIIMDGSSFGSKTINGSYDGVVGHIERKEGDLGLASLSINYNRCQAIDYTSWLEYHPTLFLTRGPRYLKDPLGVFKLYTWQAWSAIAAFLIFSASFLWLFWSCGPSSGYRLCPSVSQGQGEETLSLQYENRQHMEDETVSFFSVLTTILKAIVFQGSCHPPRSSTGRLVYVCMWMVVIIVFGVYSGNLTAFLSLPVLSMPPTTIRQLVIRDWTIKLDKAYGSHDLVKGTKTGDYQTLYRRAEERGTILENVGATSASKTNLDELLQKDIAIVMGVTGAYYMMNVNQGSDKRCILASSQEAMAKEYAALAVPKRSLLKPIFDNKLRWMRQMGVIHKYYEDSFGVKCHRDKTTSSEPAAMTLNQLLGVFYVWIGGVAVSCCIFLCELFWREDEKH